MIDNAVESRKPEEPASQTFGVLLRRLRRAAGLTQEELAELAGLSARAIADIERGRTSRPYRSSVRALATALNLSDDERDLLTRAGKPRRAEPEPGTSPGRAAQAGQNAEPGAGVTPRQLPPAVAHFVGRRAEVATLISLFDARPGATVVISAIAGAAGVGKTALAVHLAQQIADRFPDGQLYVNLRGYDEGDRVLAEDALAAMLRALGVSGQDIPVAAEERAARYRSLLADKQVLVVLDNAHGVDQVRPLLPGGNGCAVLVTSRDSLPGLVARDGAQRLELDLLPMTDAVGLLTALIGDRAYHDQAATKTLAERCSRLPLALRIAAELAAARPSSPVADLAAELADQQRRIDVLDAGSDTHTAVRAVFSWSYRHLDTGQAAAFRLAGLHPAQDFDVYAAAALTGTSLEHAAHLLSQLARTHLIQPTEPGRYGMHDLLRAYARELAGGTDGEHDCRTALTRLFDYYLHTAATAMDTLYPSESGARPRIPAPPTPIPPLTEAAAARGWLDRERANLVDMAVHTTVNGWPGHTTRLSETLYRYLQLGGHCPEAVIVYRHAFRAATDLGDDAAQAAALNRLGIVDLSQGNYRQAASHLEQALPLWRAAGSQTGEGHSLSNLATAETLQGSYRQAAEHYRQASALYREAGHRLGQASALAGLAQLDIRQRRFAPAHEQLKESLNLYRQADDQTGVAMVQGIRGEAYLRQGCYPEADDLLRKTLDACRAALDRPGEAYATVLLAGVDLKLARYQQAIRRFRRALVLYRKLGDRAGEADALNGIGEVYQATCRPGQACTAHAAASRLATEIGDRQEQARAHGGLARARATLGELGQARQHWLQALSIYSDLGLPEADQVRSELARADETAGPISRTSADLQLTADASLD
jgi:tetratricopeptide (TPR) repeat protein/transcriptional regulator with XRE-family HTH domain